MAMLHVSKSLGLISVSFLWLAFALLTGVALADGGFFKEQRFAEREPVSSPGQKAVVIRDGEAHEILLLRTTYRGPSAGFAWVVPVPGLPERHDVFEANPEAFTILDKETRPEVRVRILDPLLPAALLIEMKALASPRKVGIARAFAATLVSRILVHPLVGWTSNRLVSSVRPSKGEAMRQQRETTERLTAALTMFRDASGGYPKQLADLAASVVPATGLDASGNEVSLPGRPTMPLLPAVPVDPLTRRSGTWIYDTRSPLLVQSGAYEVRVTTETPG